MEIAFDPKKKMAYLAICLAIVAAAGWAYGLDLKQTSSIVILSSLIFATFFFWKMRVGFAFLGVSMLFVLGMMDAPHFIEFANLDIIAFLIAMMIVIGHLEENRFFEHIASKMLKLVGYEPRRVLFALLLLAGVFAALIDEVTSILIMLGIMFHLINKLNLNPVPFVIMLVFATNIGSSATVVGNPVGVLIALRAGLSFMDFVRYAAPISMIALLVAISMLFWYFKKDIDQFEKKMKENGATFTEESGAHNLQVSSAIFFGMLLLLLFHATVEDALHLTKNSMLIGTAFLGAGIALLLQGDNARRILETRVDWWTLMFFLLLFSTVGAMKYSGTIERFAESFFWMKDYAPEIGIGTVMLVSGLLSAMLDNVLAVAIFIPIIQSLESAGIANEYLWWALLFGGTFFGNLTIIGSTANIVAAGLLERRLGAKIGFGEWIRVGGPITLVTAVLAFVLLAAQSYFLG